MNPISAWLILSDLSNSSNWTKITSLWKKKLECVDLQRKNLRISKESLCGALGKVFKLVVGCGSEQIGLNSLGGALNADESPSSS